MDENVHLPVTPEESGMFNSASKSDGDLKELFHEEASQSKKPWWKTHFFVQDPVLFGTWDGVFTSCLINIFGVVLFLRTGWMVGNVGVGLSVLIVCITIAVALLASLAAMGVCERLKHVHGGGVYFIVSHVLGGKVGGTVGVMYAFGLCIVSALYCTGFAESVTETFHWDNQWAVRGVAILTLVLLLAINLAGVKWVIRLQLLLLLVLIVSTFDFIIGTMVHTEPDAGFVGYSAAVLKNNTYPSYQPGENFFTVFGVFFPTATGVMAGVNMSGDLRTPARSIPVGTLCALGLSFILYLLFVLLLGSTCIRLALQMDFMIAEKVSAVSVLWLAGLYMSSTSSCSTGLYGAPRVLQSIANQNVVPAIKFLGRGFGANKTPVFAICVSGFISLLFIFVGNLNAISPVITCNFMLVYAVIDYSYFALAMTYDLRLRNVEKYMVRYSANKEKKISLERVTYGSFQKVPTGTMREFSQDLDKIFQSDNHDKLVASDVEMLEEDSAILSDQPADSKPKSGRQHLQESFLLDEEMQASDPMDLVGEDAQNQDHIDVDHEKSISPESNSSLEQPEIIFASTVHTTPNEELEVAQKDAEGDNTGPLSGVDYDGIVESSSNPMTTTDKINLVPAEKKKKKRKRGKVAKAAEQKPEEKYEEILQQPRTWYSHLCNRWSSLFGVVLSIVVMFLIQWLYALMNILAFSLVYVYISQANPGVHPGVTKEFSFLEWIKQFGRNCCSVSEPSPEQLVLTPVVPAPITVVSEQLTSDNEDFAYRGRFHQASTGDYNYATFSPMSSPFSGH